MTDKRHSFLIAGATILLGAIATTESRSEESLLKDLPPTIHLKSTSFIPAADTARIEAKLGGKIERLTNSHLIVQGRPIMVNVITAPSEAEAKKLEAAIGKKFPYLHRDGRTLVEFVGKRIDQPLAMKTTWELGLRKKPDKIRYRVTAEIAAVDKADYMKCNPIINRFLAVGNEVNGPDDEMKKLLVGFNFGNSLRLRDPGLGAGDAEYSLQPAPRETAAKPPTVRFEFPELPRKLDVPFVKATMEIPVDGAGFTAAPGRPPAALTASTEFWPAKKVGALAKRITRGKTTNTEKVQAILEWLAPNRNLKTNGPLGTRYGVEKALEKKQGRCWDFSDVFVAMCRAEDVPAREVAGWLYGSSGHVWAEYWIEGKGWQQVDPSGGGNLPCGIYHIPWFTTEDGEMPIVYVSIPRIEIVAD